MHTKITNYTSKRIAVKYLKKNLHFYLQNRWNKIPQLFLFCWTWILFYFYRELEYDKGWTIDVDANNSVHLHNPWVMRNRPLKAVLTEFSNFDASRFLQNGEETNSNGSVFSRQFSFDYCFWSADRSSPHYASQEKVKTNLKSRNENVTYKSYKFLTNKGSLFYANFNRCLMY